MRQRKIDLSKTLLIPQGAYAVINRKETNLLKIIAPSIESCIVVVIFISKDIIAITHVDKYSPISGADAITKMFKKFPKDALRQDMTAQLYGGDWGDPFLNSSKIGKSLYKKLQDEKITYSHTVWNRDLSWLACLAVVGLWILSGAKLEYIPKMGLLVFVVFALVKYLSNHSYDVTIDIPSSKVSCVKCNKKRAIQMLEQENKNPISGMPLVYERYKKSLKGTEKDLPFISLSK